MNIVALAWLSAVTCGLYAWVLIQLFRSWYFLWCPAFTLYLSYELCYTAAWNPWNTALLIPAEWLGVGLRIGVLLEAFYLVTELIPAEERRRLLVFLGTAAMLFVAISGGLYVSSGPLDLLRIAKQWMNIGGSGAALVCTMHLWVHPPNPRAQVTMHHRRNRFGLVLTLYFCIKAGVSLAIPYSRRGAEEWSRIAMAHFAFVCLCLLLWLRWGMLLGEARPAEHGLKTLIHQFIRTRLVGLVK